MSNVFDAIPQGSRDILVKELELRNPELFAELCHAQKPTNAQSDAVVDTLTDVLSDNYGPGHVPNEYGLSVDQAIGAYLIAWPIYR